MSSFLKLLRKGHKHEKLSEEWDQNQDIVLEGLTFYVKYLGSCLVESPSGEHITAEAIKSIIAMTKACARKLVRVSLNVSPKTIKSTNVLTHEVLLEVPIHRISYCSADAHYDHVFAFIQSNKNDIMECHAFLCAKKKMAQAVTLTISQAFNLAFEVWQATKNENGENIHTNQISSHPHRGKQDCCDADVEMFKMKSSDTQDQILLIDLNCDDDKRSFTGNITNRNTEDGFVWKNHFAQFSHSSSHVPLETNLVPESMGDAFISQFLVVDHLTHDQTKEFFQDDANDLLML